MGSLVSTLRGASDHNPQSPSLRPGESAECIEPVDGTQSGDLLTKQQRDRRQALKSLSDATRLQAFEGSKGGDLALTWRGVLGIAGTSAVSYYLLRLVLRDCLKGFAWYKLLQKKSDRTKLFELYILGIVNAGIITGYSGYKLLTGSTSTQGATRVLATALGYFLHDFIAMRREFKNDKGMLLHHVIGIVVSVAVMSAGRGVKQHIPPFGMMELSTIFLDSMWLLRETGNSKTRVYKACLVAFATAFFGTRIVVLPTRLWQVWDEKSFSKLGYARHLMLALVLLNLYWFKKIVGMARKQLAA